MEPIDECEPVVPVMPTPKVVSTGKKKKLSQDQVDSEGGSQNSNATLVYCLSKTVADTWGDILQDNSLLF